MVLYCQVYDRKLPNLSLMTLLTALMMIVTSDQRVEEMIQKGSSKIKQAHQQVPLLLDKAHD